MIIRKNNYFDNTERVKFWKYFLICIFFETRILDLYKKKYIYNAAILLAE